MATEQEQIEGMIESRRKRIDRLNEEIDNLQKLNSGDYCDGKVIGNCFEGKKKRGRPKLLKPTKISQISRKGKYSDELIPFLEKHVNDGNNEVLRGLVRDKFGYKLSYNYISVLLSKNKIKRGKKIGKKGNDCEKASKKEIAEDEKYSKLSKDRKAQDRLSNKVDKEIKEFIWNHSTKMAEELRGMIAERFGEKMTREDIIGVRKLRKREQEPCMGPDDEEDEGNDVPGYPDDEEEVEE